MTQESELLAPAGSIASLKAAIEAGADAVYMGAARFGARAYAENPSVEEYLSAIDYVHLRGKKLFLTLNTVIKESELSEAIKYLAPFYAQGIDAVIVQDFGLMQAVLEKFPGLPVHASTQMTVTGWRSARKLKELGVTRIVTPRELSLSEIARIHEKADVEIEAFVHGALCYCYSGQCLMSGFIGGRSGNRGRCAQPCRLQYEYCAGENKTGQVKKLSGSLISMKDLCGLKDIPGMLDSGVYSFKIEGRMKSPLYTAGVVSIYRKHLDMCASGQTPQAEMIREDEKKLLSLFDRGGFTDGYFHKHNGRDMIAVQGRTDRKAADDAFLKAVSEKYLDTESPVEISGRADIHTGKPANIELFLKNDRGEVSASAKGETVQTAKSSPLEKTQVEKLLSQTGGTGFLLNDIQADCSADCFLPVRAVKELRRAGLKNLSDAILKDFRREAPENAAFCADKIPKKETCADRKKNIKGMSVLVQSAECAKRLAAMAGISRVLLQSGSVPAEKYAACADICHANGCECFLAMPHIFRDEAERYFDKYTDLVKNAGFDGFLVRSLEESAYLLEKGISARILADANLYAANAASVSFVRNHAADACTSPAELTIRELSAMEPCEETEVYGHQTFMVSAQCLKKTCAVCEGKNDIVYIKDRMGKKLPVMTFCDFCYNLILNPLPLETVDLAEEISLLSPVYCRLSFTTESPKQCEAITDAYIKAFLRGERQLPVSGEFTRGHMHRGVE